MHFCGMPGISVDFFPQGPGSNEVERVVSTGGVGHRKFQMSVLFFKGRWLVRLYRG